MLLNKYESFAVIAKDAFAEELLFKIEKNFGNYALLQEKCFAYLLKIVQLAPVSAELVAEAD